MIDLVEAHIIAGQENELYKPLWHKPKKNPCDSYLLQVSLEAFRMQIQNTILKDVYAKYRHICLETSGGFGFDI